MNRENELTINNLIYALLFLVLGIILITSTDDLVGMISKVIGSILIIFGIVKLVVYIYMKGKLGEYKTSELIIGLLIIGLGILLILYASTLSFVIRIIFGMWALFAGVNRIIFAIYMKSLNRVGFRMYLITSLIMILVGILLISGLLDQMIGLLIIIYAITEIVDYIYYKSTNKDYVPVEKQKSTKENKKIKRLKDKKVVDAVIEEDN